VSGWYFLAGAAVSPVVHLLGSNQFQVVCLKQLCFPQQTPFVIADSCHLGQDDVSL